MHEEIEKQSHDTSKQKKVKGFPKSYMTYGSSTLDESVKGEKDQDDLTQIPSMESLQQQIK